MVDFDLLLKDYGVSADFTRAKSGWVNVSCPYCDTTGKHRHLGINAFSEYAYCFKCGYHPFDSTLADMLNTTAASLRELKKEYSVKRETLALLNQKAVVYKKSLKLADKPLTRNERLYLKKRGFRPNETISKYRLQSGGLAGDWKYRIIIPVFVNNVLVTWTSRAISDSMKPRYKTLAARESRMNIKDTLYNLDNCVKDTVVLLEGPVDVMRFGDNGSCGFGMSLTDSQVKTLSARFNNVIIIFDNESKALDKALNYKVRLQSAKLNVDVIRIKGLNDIGETDKKTIEKIKGALML
jgi:DNA primase